MIIVRWKIVVAPNAQERGWNECDRGHEKEGDDAMNGLICQVFWKKAMMRMTGINRIQVDEESL